MKRNNVITEGHLRQIVKESVKKVLSEMDWRTLANAGKKDKKGRSDKFFKAATKSFNDKHGFDEHDKVGNTNSAFSAELGDREYSTQERKYSDGKLYQRRNQPNDNYEMYDKWEFDENDYPSFKNLQYNHSYRGPKDQFGDHTANPHSKEFAHRIKQAKKELEDFYRGNSSYDKGKWKQGKRNYLPSSY